MKNFFKDSSGKSAGTAAAVVLFLSLIAAALTVPAQNINNDLQPKKPAATPKTPVRSTPKKPVRSRTNNRARQNRNAPTNNNSQPTAPVTAPTPRPVPPPTVVAQPVVPVAPVVPTENPQQILGRFMNFQQSASVTSKDWESVVSQVAPALQAYPNDAAAKAQLFTAQGYLAYNKNDYSTALIQFNAAAQVLPDSALPVYSIGRVYLVTKQPRDAEKAFEKAIKLKKDFALAYKGMGDALTAQGKAKKAQDYYKQAAQVGLVENQTGGVNSSTSNDPNGNNGLGEGKGDAQPNSAQLSAYDLELKAARSLTANKKWQNSLEKLLPLAQTSPTADLYIAIGDNYFGMEQWLSAQQAYRKATEINAQSALGFYKSGMVLFELNEYDAAAEAFEKSLIFDQEGKTINRGQARKMADRAKEKADDLKKGGRRNFLGL